MAFQNSGLFSQFSYTILIYIALKNYFCCWTLQLHKQQCRKPLFHSSCCCGTNWTELRRCRHVTNVPDHVGYVTKQSTDKIGDLFIDNRGFWPQVSTKLNSKEYAATYIFAGRFILDSSTEMATIKWYALFSRIE